MKIIIRYKRFQRNIISRWKMFQLLFTVKNFSKKFQIGWILETKIVFSSVSQFSAISQLRPSRRQIALCCDCDLNSEKWIVLVAKLRFFAMAIRNFAIFHNSFYNPANIKRFRNQNSGFWVNFIFFQCKWKIVICRIYFK